MERLERSGRLAMETRLLCLEYVGFKILEGFDNSAEYAEACRVRGKR